MDEASLKAGETVNQVRELKHSDSGIVLIIKALNYAKPSQPASPAQLLSGKKMHHFALLFSSNIFREREIMAFKNQNNKILSGPKTL